MTATAATATKSAGASTSATIVPHLTNRYASSSSRRRTRCTRDALLSSKSSLGHRVMSHCSIKSSSRQHAVTIVSAQQQEQQMAQPPMHASGSPINVKVVGIGSRGASALQKLVQQEGFANQAELWCLDVDQAALNTTASIANTMLVPKEGTSTDKYGPLSSENLLQVVGQPASDAEGRGNIGGAVDGGVAFVLAPASSIPGGPELVLQLVTALRSAGHFTVAAVTRPFGFEGSGKYEAATNLIAALEGRAHLVAVMEQEVLMQAFGDSQLTVAEATDISDNALERTARCILQAVQAQELLKSSRGGLMWHGRDLRHYRRLLSPPLQQLLTCPGTAVLGRGLATLPAETAHQMGAANALMHLASDAVLAAGESPFLDGALEQASAVLCCISLPAIDAIFNDGSGSAMSLGGLNTPEGERHATRMAAQAAAGALRGITSRGCDDFVLCVEPLPMGSNGSNTADTIKVEATLLVLRAPEGSAAAAKNLAANQQFPPSPPVRASVPQPKPSASNATKRLPPTNWSMLSAMAGGSKSAPPSSSSPQKQQQQPTNTRQPSVGAFGSPLQGAVNNGSTTNTSPPPRAPSQPQQQQSSSTTKKPVNVVRPTKQQPQEEEEEGVTVGDYLAESLTAQSLDLPPAAARWRQQQRAADNIMAQRRLVVWEAQGSADEDDVGIMSDDDDDVSEEEEDVAGGIVGMFRGKQKKKEVSLRDRMSSILARDREDGGIFDDPPPPSSSLKR